MNVLLVCKRVATSDSQNCDPKNGPKNWDDHVVHVIESLPTDHVIRGNDGEHLTTNHARRSFPQ